MSNNINSGSEKAQPLVYQIRIQGHLGREWTDWFGGLTIILEDNGDTLLTGPVVDQAALHGLLKKVRDLGMPLVSVNRGKPGQADNVCPLITRKKMSGEHSFQFPLATLSQGRATLTNCREHERTVRVTFKKGAQKMISNKITTGMDTKVKLSGSDRGSLVADPTEGETTMNSPKRLARIAGVLYLLVGIFGGFAEGFVEPKMYVAGNAATTASNLLANAGLVRLGVVADLFQATVFVFLGMTLYLLLKHVHKSAASAMVVLVAIATSIMCLNDVFEFEGLRAATGAVNLAAFGTAGSHALVLLLLDTQHYGLLIAQIFFGLWLVPLGYLAYKSAGWFPKWLGVLLIAGGACYLVDMLAQFLVPDFGQNIHVFFSVVAAIAEISMVLYLLVIGVKTVKPDERILAAE